MNDDVVAMKAVRLPILCLDWDGVIHSYVSGWKGAEVIPDPPVAGAIAFLYEAVKHFEVHIYSSRSHQAGGIEAMQTWLKRYDTEYRIDWQVPASCTPLLLSVQWPTEKPSAFVTIDDRALTFTGEWPDMESLRTFKPWNK